jgi:hypothetical protein
MRRGTLRRGGGAAPPATGTWGPVVVVVAGQGKEEAFFFFFSLSDSEVEEWAPLEIKNRFTLRGRKKGDHLNSSTSFCNHREHRSLLPFFQRCSPVPLGDLGDSWKRALAERDSKRRAN